MTLRGIDVSEWQRYTPSLTGLSFLFARASIGMVPDIRYKMHVANARKEGLLVGAYHFNYDGASITGQADFFLRSAGDVDFYALDVEGTNAFSQAQARQFIARVQSAGREVGLYHSLSGYPNVGQNYNWIAKWSDTPPTLPWTFWQHRGSPLDLDKFNGTLDDLRALAHHPALPDSSTEDPMIPISVNTAGPYLVTLTIGDQLYDQSFRPLVKSSVAATVPGYFLTGTGYVGVVVTTGDQRQLAFAKAADVGIRAVPAADCSAVQAKLDTAIASATAAKAQLATAEDRIRRGIGILGGTLP